MTHKGSCHCGRIEFEVEGEPEQLIQCNCSHCDRKGYLLWFVGQDQLRLLTPEADLATYTFNKHIIQHHFCPTCGCAPYGRGEAPGSGAPMAPLTCAACRNWIAP